MSFDWFKFRAKAFYTDTQRLNTEAKGAYLLLMLSYYEEETPPPDDDMVLSTITGLPMETWLRYRPYIAAKFEIADGLWHHAYCEAEIIDCKARHTRAVTARTYGKSNPKTDVASDVASHPASDARSRPEPPPRRPRPRHADTGTDVTSHPTSKSDVTSHATSDAGTERRATDIERDIKQEESANALSPRVSYAEELSSVVKEIFAPIPNNFSMTGAMVIECQSEGYTSVQIAPIFDSFFRYHDSAGTLDPDWPAAWRRWWDKRKPPLHPSEKPGALPKAPPRVEVSRKAPTRKMIRPVPDDWAPNERHHEIATEQHVSLADSVESFRDHCLNKPTDWNDYNAAFRNWLKSPYRPKVNANGQTPRRGSITDVGDRLAADLDRRIEAAESAERGGDPPVQILPKD